MTLTSQNKIETNKIELQVRVDGEAFKAALEKAYRTKSAKITVPGFRKGKAPRHVIEKMYGEGIFLEDAVNDTYAAAYEAAISESKLEPVSSPEVEVLDVNKEGYNFKAVVTVKPEVSVKDYKGIAASKNAVAVSDEDVDAEVEKLRDRNSRMVTVEDRAAENGDTVVFDFDGYVDGTPFSGGKAENFSLELGSGQFIPGFEGQVVGHSTGDEFDVNVTFPEDYHAEELKGRAAVFKCKIHEIKEKELPDLDDEFAKDVSEFDTLADLKADLKTKLQEKNDHKAQDDFENQLIDKVVEGLEGEIPEVMYENKIGDMVRDFEQRLQTQGLKLKQYLEYIGMEMDSFRMTFRAQAERQVKVRLALDKIAELEGFTVSDEELEAEYKKVAESYNLEAEKVKQYIPDSEITKDIKANKAIDFIRDNAVVTGETEEKAPAKKKAARKKKEETETVSE